MSYSRWSNSNWYAFHNCSSGEEKEDQILSLWYCGSEKLVNLPYDELIEIKSPKELAFYYDVPISIDDLIEAMQYVNMFLEDIEEDFDGDKK